MINTDVPDYIIPSPPSPTKKTRINPRNITIKNLVKPITSLSLSAKSEKRIKEKENQENQENSITKESLRKRGRLGSISASISAGWEKMKEMTRSVINKTPVVSTLRKAASSYNLSKSSRKSTSESNASSETFSDDSFKNIRTLQTKQKSGSIGLFKGSFLRNTTKNSKEIHVLKKDVSIKAMIGPLSAVKTPTNAINPTKKKGRSLSLQNYPIKSNFSKCKLELPAWPMPAIAASKSDKNTNTSKDSVENVQRTSDMQDLLTERFPIKNGFYFRYKLKDLLGDGAFGFVFTAIDLSDGKEV